MDAPSLQGSATDAPRPWGIIGAMDVEVQLLADAMEQVRTHAFGGCRCASGVLDGAPCVIAQCGVGMVHAAACTQMLIDRFDVRAVVNTGVAGSLRKDIHRKELVIATEALNWVMDVQNLGYAAGQTPGLDTPFLPTSDTINRQALAAARAEGVTAHCGRIASGDRFVRVSRKGADRRGVRRPLLRDGRCRHRSDMRCERRALFHPARHLRQCRWR